MFIDNEGNVAVAAAHDWKLDDTTGYQTCLIKASIDCRVFKYPEHSDTLPHINPIGKISQDFFLAGAIVFRLVTTLEAYLRTSGELNHHR